MNVEPETGLTLADLISWVGCILFVAAGAAVAVWMSRRVRKEQETSAAEEARFAERMVKNLGAASEPAPAAPPAAAPIQASFESQPPPPPDRPAAGPSDLAALVRQLMQLRVIAEKQGELPLPSPPNGLIYRLSRGGTVALLPRFESEATMAHLAQRFDVVIVANAAGRALVFERFESRLKELLGDDSTFGG